MTSPSTSENQDMPTAECDAYRRHRTEGHACVTGMWPWRVAGLGQHGADCGHHSRRTPLDADSPLHTLRAAADEPDSRR
jgi:hypothetical protein